MLQDLHSHTYYSFCGEDTPEVIVEAAISAGLELFGICDHNYGIGYGRIDAFQTPEGTLSADYGRMLRRYFDHMNLIREKYRDRITVLRGIELCTLPEWRYHLPDGADISYFDYCLIENLDRDGGVGSVTNGDLFSYAKRLGCKVGIAHTDMFAFITARGEDPLAYFTHMAEMGIFWEMNVSCDSIHKYRQHDYMLRFFEDGEQQDIIRKSGVELSVGFDGHRTRDYLPERITRYCRRLEELGIRMAFEK